MKVLVISMLRMGDLIMHKPLIDGLKKNGFEVHLLCNEESKKIKFLFDKVISKFFFFRRSFFQKTLSSDDFHILYGTMEIKEFISTINMENYEKVFNLTHNKVSSFLAGAIGANKHHGSYWNHVEFKGLENPWFKYYNSHFSMEKGSVFHSIDVLSKAFQIKTERRSQRRNALSQGLILFQCFTSDPKKNMDLLFFKNLKKMIEEKYPFHLVRILSTEEEEKKLKEIFFEEEIWVADMEVAFLLLKEASILVSGDTSIKHLATEAGTPVLEIHVGSADPIKTSAYAKNVFALKSSVSCYPCKASEKCPQESFKCHEDLLLLNSFNCFERILKNEPGLEDIDIIADQNLWESYLEGYSDKIFSPSTEYIQNTQNLIQWQMNFERLFQNSMHLENKEILSRDDMSFFILLAQEILKSKKDHGGYFVSLVDALTHLNPVGKIMMRGLENALRESRSLIGLRSEKIKEIYNGSKSRNVFEASP